MEKELLDIARQLHELSQRLEALIAKAEPAVSPEPIEEPEPETEPVAEPSENSENSECSECSEPSESPEPAEIHFSLNDRYRFLRELFGNSQMAMAETVNAVAAMRSAEEVAAHLDVNLGWDIETPGTARDFFTAVTRHFNPRANLLA